MKFKIKSRKMCRVLTFSRPGSEYIYVDINDQPGTLGRQICKGGNLSGPTLHYSGEDQKEFERICRSWYRSLMRKE